MLYSSYTINCKINCRCGTKFEFSSQRSGFSFLNEITGLYCCKVTVLSLWCTHLAPPNQSSVLATSLHPGKKRLAALTPAMPGQGSCTDWADSPSIPQASPWWTFPAAFVSYGMLEPRVGQAFPSRTSPLAAGGSCLLTPAGIARIYLAQQRSRLRSTHWSKDCCLTPPPRSPGWETAIVAPEAV